MDLGKTSLPVKRGCFYCRAVGPSLDVVLRMVPGAECTQETYCYFQPVLCLGTMHGNKLTSALCWGRFPGSSKAVFSCSLGPGV